MEARECASLQVPQIRLFMQCCNEYFLDVISPCYANQCRRTRDFVGGLHVFFMNRANFTASSLPPDEGEREREREKVSDLFLAQPMALDAVHMHTCGKLIFNAHRCRFGVNTYSHTLRVCVSPSAVQLIHIHTPRVIHTVRHMLLMIIF